MFSDQIVLSLAAAFLTPGRAKNWQALQKMGRAASGRGLRVEVGP
jgi:hypothetical protein